MSTVCSALSWDANDNVPKMPGCPSHHSHLCHVSERIHQYLVLRIILKRHCGCTTGFFHMSDKIFCSSKCPGLNPRAGNKIQVWNIELNSLNSISVIELALL